MPNKRKKAVAKVAVASTLAVTTVAGIVYTTPKIIKTVASEETSKIDFMLKTESIDRDTVKVYIDNVNDMPKSFQFSIKLEGVIPKLNEGNLSIKDLIKENNSNAITTYTYNSSDNTIDVLVTSTEGIGKIVKYDENDKKKDPTELIEIFELDVEKASNNTGKEYLVKAKENSEYKYLTSENKEIQSKFNYEENKLLINSAPTLTKNEGVNYIELNIKEEVTLTEEKLKEYVTVNDEDNDDVTLKVTDKDGVDYTGKKFSKSKVGIYDLYITANDTLVDSDKLTLQVKVSDNKQKPIISKDGQELKDIVIKPGQFKTREELLAYLKDDVKATDSDNKDLEVKIEIPEDIELNPEDVISYIVRYSATDKDGRNTIKEIALIIKEELVEDPSNPGDGSEGDQEGDSGNQGGNGGDQEGDNGNQGGDEGDQEEDNGNQGGNGGDQEGDNGSQDGDDGDSIIEIPGFIEDIIISDVVSKGEGNGSIESPLELEVKDISLENFKTFLLKLKTLNPLIVDKYEEENFTVYKIKVEDPGILASIMRLFKESVNDNGYIYLRVSNDLEAANEIIAEIDANINIENSEGDNGNQGGNGGTTTPEEDNGNQGGNGGTTTPEGDNGNQGGSGETTTPEGDNGNQDQSEEIITPDKNEESNGIKLPITGQESILGYVAAAIIAIGGGLFFYRKKK